MNASRKIFLLVAFLFSKYPVNGVRSRLSKRAMNSPDSPGAHYNGILTLGNNIAFPKDTQYLDAKSLLVSIWLLGDWINLDNLGTATR